MFGFQPEERLDLAETFQFFGRGRQRRKLISAAAHAPYSVSAALFQAISRWNNALPAANGAPGGIPGRAGFSGERQRFFPGPAQKPGTLAGGFLPPGAEPGSLSARAGLPGAPHLAVHGVWLEEPDCRLLARSETWLVLCPRANRYTGAGVPPVDRLLQTGVNLALGTDSLAGNWDLNLFGEMRWLHRNFPAYPGDLWLRLGTLNGAAGPGP